MKIGFACLWERVPQRSWSGIPWALRQALRSSAEVVDLGIEHSAVQDLFKCAHARRWRGEWITTYRWSESWDSVVEKRLQSSLHRTSVDAAIEMGDLARLDVPFYLYQDLNYDVLREYFFPAIGVPGFKGIDLQTIEKRRERQHKVYEAAAGVFAMSEWFATRLVELSGVPRNKVNVVYAGLNAVDMAMESDPEAKCEETEDPADPAKLLFVGRDFFRKGGDMAVAALERLRRDYSPGLRLTVVGPKRWPLSGQIPSGVDYLGPRTSAEVARLCRTHDLFVMPSRFEAFGIAFQEALASGLPVIGRRGFAMSEIITPGMNGALVDSDDPDGLAGVIATVLDNPEIKKSTRRAAKGVRARFSWEAVAQRMLSSMGCRP